MVTDKKAWGLRALLGVILLAAVFFNADVMTSHAQDIVVVIDPGHGGENLGGQWAGYDEKDLNLVTAQAMKEYLELFDGVTVYLTRETDAELSLQERADFAAEKNADFLFCLHYNMSSEHTLFGSEVWVSAFADMYRPGCAFAQIQMAEMEEMGLFSRGIKTRLNTKGTDYYGVIRACTAYRIPSAIIEHCHLDEARDTAFWSSTEKLKKFGVADATAAAKYFRLKSDTLGLDYSGFEVPEVVTQEKVMRPDTVAPEYCRMVLESVDYESGQVSVSVEAADADTSIQYIEFSCDGGYTWQQLQPFNGERETFTLQMKMGTTPILVARAYDLYDLKTESPPIRLDTFPILPKPVNEKAGAETIGVNEEAAAAFAPISGDGIISATEPPYQRQDIVLFILLGVLVALFMILTGFFLSIYITSRKYRRRYRTSQSIRQKSRRRK